MAFVDRVSDRVKLRDLRLLDVVVRSKSMARAASQLNLTQPAVSKAVSELERVLGVRLLDRSRHGIEPTPYGRALLKRGAVIFDEIRQGVAEIEFLSDPTAGQVRVAAPDPIAAGLLPVVVAQLSDRYPRMSIYVTQGPIAALDHHMPQYSVLRDRKVDFVLGQLVEEHSADLRMERLFDDYVTVVAGMRSKWARRRKIALADLLDEPWCLPPADSIAGVRCRKVFYDSGLPLPANIVVSVSVQVQIGLAAQRFLTILPTSVLWFGGQRLSIRAIAIEGTSGPPRAVGIITLKNRTTSPSVQLFVDEARKLTGSLVNRKWLSML